MLMSVIIRLSERNVPHEVLEIWFDWFISTAASRLRPTIKYDKGPYGRNGLVATIKGSASGVDRVKYTSQAGNGSVPVKSGTFVVNVPVTDTTQQIKLTAGSLKREVNVKAGTSLGQYTAIATKFNQMLAVSSLSKADQAKLKQGQAAAAEASEKCGNDDACRKIDGGTTGTDAKNIDGTSNCQYPGQAVANHR